MCWEPQSLRRNINGTADQAVTMLEDEDPRSFSFTDDFFAWRDWKIGTERLQYRRKFVKVFRQLQLR